uniref:FecR family protein n=1 Tax=Pedobacter schmidteae TaxID=2201271 RepID=UPI000EB35814|nr:FecR family protein [Pedobacter schmidteae]
MNQTEAITLLKKYQAGVCSEAEKIQLESWYLQWHNDTSSFEEADLLALQNEMWAAMPKPTPQKTIRLWPKIAIAASVLIALSAGVWFYTASDYPERSAINKNLPAQDVAPGKNTATLSLDNGKIINLSSTKSGVVIDATNLKYNDGTAIADSETGATDQTGGDALLTATTPRGGTYQIILPDGTKVWLNAASSIKFPSVFNKSKERKVQLTGEAYFEVTKDKTKPFIVVTDKQEVEVLGTHFNINSYADEKNTRTTLLEGAVKVSAFKSSTLLSPNQQAILTGDKVRVETVDPEGIVAWKNGNFNFNDEDLESIMRKVARWYDVEVYYKDNLPQTSFLGTLSRSKNLSALLKIMEESGKVHFKLEGRRITVMK